MNRIGSSIACFQYSCPANLNMTNSNSVICSTPSICYSASPFLCPKNEQSQQKQQLKHKQQPQIGFLFGKKMEIIGIPKVLIIYSTINFVFEIFKIFKFIEEFIYFKLSV